MRLRREQDLDSAYALFGPKDLTKLLRPIHIIEDKVKYRLYSLKKVIIFNQLHN
jgi:hypothetical protein